MNAQDIMLALIRYEICGIAVDSKVLDSLNSDMLSRLYSISKAHDMVHIVGKALNGLEILGDSEISSKFQKAILTAVYRYEGLAYELNQITAVLEEAQIPFIALKGSVIRNLYPESWMRTSCDIDILVHEEDLDKALSTLKDKLSYTSDGKRDYHDISLYSQSRVHLELHFNIFEAIDALDAVLKDVWKNSVLTEGKSYNYRLTDEFLIFHIVAHMAYHFLFGGCGVRPFIDLYLLRQNLQIDERKLNALLDKAGLCKFYECLICLCDVWLNGYEHTNITQKMQDYILLGGVYGSLENRVALQQQKKSGRISYLFSRVFLPYNKLKDYYPILKKYPVLTPVMEIRRWGRIIFCGRLKMSARELELNSSMSQDKQQLAKELLSELGL